MPKHSDIVAKSNDLIPAISSLDLQQLRLLAFCLSHVDSKHDKTFNELTARVEEISSLFGIDHHDVYREIKKAVIAINQKPAEFIENGVSWVKFWFSSIGYHSGSGEFYFKLNDDLAPKLLELKDNFTVYRIRDVYQFARATTWHLYECLRRWKVAGLWNVDFDELRFLLNLGNKYQRYADFKKRILIPGVDEINSVSDIYVYWKSKKVGRKVNGLMFTISVNEDNLSEREKAQKALSHLDDGDDFDPEMTSILHDLCGINLKQARQLANLIAQEGKINQINALIPKLLTRWNNLKDKTSNLGGYCFKAITDELNT